ncbi:LYAM2-like protein [Mya arenaria]|uniref:LYAM2-like protein n=1 Tax=Mya arenaria TaxID=6604 RepID=A0ABY7DEI0_MYAAR|nr:LYAM2-like protein [Mya arenaria]
MKKDYATSLVYMLNQINSMYLSNIIDMPENSPLQSVTVGGCAIDSNVKVCQCTRDVLEIQRTRVMPFGVSCIVYDDNVEYNRSCYDNRNEGVGSLVGGVFGPIGRAIGVAVGLVVDIICIFLCGKQDPPPENKPPYVKTPARLHSTSTIIAGSGKTNATVSWTVPTFYDKEDAKELKTTPANFRSNGMYPEGSHAVFFAAEDSKGLPVQTGLRDPLWKSALAEYGKLDCTNSDNRNIFGTKCALKCDRGYISPRSMTQCTKTGTWNPSKALDCKPVTCQPPDLEKDGRDIILYDCPNLYTLGANCTLDCKGGYPLAGLREPLNGAISCSGWTYGQMCIMQCQKGFDVPASIDGQFVCGTSTGKWRPSSKVPNCNAYYASAFFKSDVKFSEQ